MDPLLPINSFETGKSSWPGIGEAVRDEGVTAGTLSRRVDDVQRVLERHLFVRAEPVVGGTATAKVSKSRKWSCNKALVPKKTNPYGVKSRLDHAVSS